MKVNDLAIMRGREVKAKNLSEWSQLWVPWLYGKVSIRVEFAIRRAYYEGHLTKPINKLTDDELLRVRQIGVKALKQIRHAIAAKESLKIRIARWLGKAEK